MTDYSAPTPATTTAMTPAENPGKVLGIVGFVVSFFISLAGLIISIVAMMKSKKAGQSNGFALAGIIIGALGVVGTIIVIIAVTALTGAAVGSIVEFCNANGSGQFVVDGTTYNCP